MTLAELIRDYMSNPHRGHDDAPRALARRYAITPEGLALLDSATEESAPMCACGSCPPAPEARTARVHPAEVNDA